MEQHQFLFNFIIFLAAAVVVVPLCKRIGMGSVLGYLIAGSIVGPWGLKFVTDVNSILGFAEFGVVLLLFIIGLELKPSRLWVMRKSVFGMGSLQVLASTALIGALSHALGLSWLVAGVIGFALSLSSTAFVLQILSERNQLNTEFGRLSFAVLLFQDLATIPVLAAVPLLGVKSEADPSGLGLKLGMAALTITVIIISGRLLLRPIFRTIAASRIKEIFTAASLLLVVGIAYVMSLVGLSMALGTFLAGVLLADSEYRHELEINIDPFKGLLLGLFFMAIGMSVDYGLILQAPLLVVELTAALLIVKFVVLFFTGRIAGLSNTAARSLASALPQVGEFAFVLLGMLAADQLVDPRTRDLLVVVVTLSMAITPLLLVLNERVSQLARRTPKNFDTIEDEHNPVIIAGFGRVGQIVARILRLQDIGFTALEHDSEQVEAVRRFGSKVFYGDASRIDLLKAAGADHAKVFVLAIDNIESSLRTAAIVKEHFPNLKVYARARNRQHAWDLLDLGVDLFHRETLGSSLWLARDLLVEFGLSPSVATETIEKFKLHDEKVLMEQYKVHDDEAQLINYSKQAAQQVIDVFKADQKGDSAQVS